MTKKQSTSTNAGGLQKRTKVKAGPPSGETLLNWPELPVRAVHSLPE